MADRDEARRTELFEELAATGSTAARNELVESYAPLAEYFAARYRNRSQDQEDIRQVAQLALVKAVDRFDADFGVAFSTFAGRTIDGELKRHFRDRAWAVRVPRSLKEASLVVRKAADDLTAEHGRSPTVDALVERTGLEIDLVLQALDVRSAMDAHSLDEPSGADDGRTIASTLGDDDRGMERTEVAMAMRTVLATLPERERVMVELRFYQNLTQQEIADRMGMSQMHVSRLLRRSMATLREQLR